MAEEQEYTVLKNTVTIEEAGPCKKKVVVEIPEDTVKNATDAQYETLRKEALVPGFRKGRHHADFSKKDSAKRRQNRLN